MVDINLLPEELRKKEEQEKKAIAKKPPELELILTSPIQEQKKESTKKPSFFARLFYGKKAAQELPTPQKSPQPPGIQGAAMPQKQGKYEFQAPKKVFVPAKSKQEILASGELSVKEDIIPKEISTPSKEKGLMAPTSTLKPEPKMVPKEPPKPPLPPKLKVFPQLSQKRKFHFFEWLRSLFSFKRKEKGKITVLPQAKTIPKIFPWQKVTAERPVKIFEEIQKRPIPKPPAQPAKPTPRKKVAPVTRVSPKFERAVEKPFKTLEINLIPDELARHLEINIGRKIFFYIISICFSVILLYVARQLINWYQIDIGDQIREIQARIESLNKDVKNYDTLLIDARILQDQLARVEGLLGRHLYWTEFFDTLQKYTIDEVFYTNLAASSGGGVTVSAIGKDYESVARQLKVFQEATDFAVAVNINSASAITDEENNILYVNFNVVFIPNPDVFYIQFQKE